MTTTARISHPAAAHPGAAPRDILLATFDGGGHAGPMLSIAAALIAREHRVRVLADPVLRPEVEAAGAEFVAWHRAPHNARAGRRAQVITRDWERRTPGAAGASLRDRLTCGPAAAFAADARAELHRRPADVVVADVLLPGVLIGAEAAGARTVAVSASGVFLPEWGVPPMGSGLAPGGGPVDRAKAALAGRLMRRMWRPGLAPLNDARAAHGLAPWTDPLQLVSHWDRVLVLTSAALEFPQFAPPPHVVVAGARLDDPSWADPWSPPPGDAPLVLVALSSTYMGQQAVLRRAAAALGRLPVRGVVTTGPGVDPSEVPAPPNVQVVRSAPHRQVLRHAAAVVTHAGHGTTAKALAAGVPLLALPCGRDQPDVAARIVATGAGLRLPPTASPRRIAAAVGALLDDPSYADAARRAARRMAGERRHDRAVAEIEALVRA